jgi:hypothetical protein
MAWAGSQEDRPAPYLRDYLDSLSSSNKLKSVKNLEVVFHFSPPELLAEPAYLGMRSENSYWHFQFETRDQSDHLMAERSARKK